MFSFNGGALIGWLTLASDVMYGSWGPTAANTVVGAGSVIIDNIPVMVAVLSMQPKMSNLQWLSLTSTCAVCGSLLSIGSAARVALMVSAREQYTFTAHL